MTKRTKTFYKSRGFLVGTGKTAAEAKTDLERQIDWACSHASSIIESRFGFLIAISASPTGWQYCLFNPADLDHGQQKHPTCCYGQTEYTDVLLSARSHAAQNAWTHECLNDAEFVAMAGLNADKAEELTGWINWQRNYRAAKNAGMSDDEAFNHAHGWKNVATRGGPSTAFA